MYSTVPHTSLLWQQQLSWMSKMYGLGLFRVHSSNFDNILYSHALHRLKVQTDALSVLMDKWLQKQPWPYSLSKSGKNSSDLHENRPHWCVFMLQFNMWFGVAGKVMIVAVVIQHWEQKVSSKGHLETWVDTGDVAKDATYKWEEIIEHCTSKRPLVFLHYATLLFMLTFIHNLAPSYPSERIHIYSPIVTLLFSSVFGLHQSIKLLNLSAFHARMPSCHSLIPESVSSPKMSSISTWDSASHCSVL